MNLELWCDISQWQNGYPPASIDFFKMRDAGAIGVVIRKSVKLAHDAMFEPNWQDAGDAGLKRSIYWVPSIMLDAEAQKKVASEWPSGGPFEDQLDIPAWIDVELKSRLVLPEATRRILSLMQWSKERFGGTDVYTAPSVWNDFYSNRPGWDSDWDLIVANYRPALYTKPILELRSMIASAVIQPSLPIGWKTWRQWQISADGNGLGAAFGGNSFSIDISFRKIDADNPGVDPDAIIDEIVALLTRRRAVV